MSTISAPPHPSNAGPLDWSQTPLEAEYAGHYVKIIDNLFSDAECAELIALALSDQEWQQAEVNHSLTPGDSSLVKDYRNGERIIRFDVAAGQKIYEKLFPYIQEIVKVRPGSEWEGIFGTPGKVKDNWDCVGINECLRFLRYEEGGFFRPHCDGQLELPDGRCARVTVQVYLGEGEIEGGATRIYGRWDLDRYYDVEPKKGRVLIFQARNIVHSGDDVVKGVKYALRTELMFRRSKPGLLSNLLKT